MAKRRKRPLIYRLKKKADKALSDYVRYWTKKTYGDKCPLCGINPIQCCFHFITRRRKILRWVHKNTIGACHKCNFKERHYPDPSRAWFIIIFGVELYLELVELSKQDFEPTEEYLQGIIDKYTAKLEELKNTFKE